MPKIGFYVKFYVKYTLLGCLEWIKLDILPENFMSILARPSVTLDFTTPRALHRSPPQNIVRIRKEQRFQRAFNHENRVLPSRFIVFTHRRQTDRPTDTHTHVIVVFNRVFRIREAGKPWLKLVLAT